MKDNKKYIDKVIEHLVRGTKIDYDNILIFPPFISSPISFILSSVYFLPFTSRSVLIIPFVSYCKNTYGLTEEEIEYVWNEFKEIILGKINQ